MVPRRLRYNADKSLCYWRARDQAQAQVSYMLQLFRGKVQARSVIELYAHSLVQCDKLCGGGEEVVSGKKSTTFSFNEFKLSQKPWSTLSMYKIVISFKSFSKPKSKKICDRQTDRQTDISKDRQRDR